MMIPAILASHAVSCLTPFTQLVPGAPMPAQLLLAYRAPRDQLTFSFPQKGRSDGVTLRRSTLRASRRWGRPREGWPYYLDAG